MEKSSNMKKSNNGNVHKTYILKHVVIQKLNPDFWVPNITTTNKLVNLLKKHGIIAARVIKQTSKIRIFEKLDGEFYDKFTYNQAYLAIKFIKKVHKIINNSWGDVNASNFLWHKGRIVGIIDYDTIGRDQYDVVMAMVNWQSGFSNKYAKMIAKTYGLKNGWINQMRQYILYSHKQWSDVYLGLDHIKKSKKEVLRRIKRLNYQYEKSFSWKE